jgi:hypothetical protein
MLAQLALCLPYVSYRHFRKTFVEIVVEPLLPQISYTIHHGVAFQGVLPYVDVLLQVTT